MKEERNAILQKLIHNPGSSFNDLWSKKGPSNKFAYHLKVLEEDGFVEKKDDKYALTHEGKKYVAYADGKTGKQQKFPVLCTTIVVFDGDQVLMSYRKKEPFFNYWGFLGGKVEFTQYILENAKEELREESGLECDLELKGLVSCKTFSNEQLSYNYQLFVIRGSNPRGTLIKQTREGINQWIPIPEVCNRKIFLNTAEVLEIAQGKTFRWIEMDREQKNDKFTQMNIVRDEKL